jgi:hypothetical protein
MRFLFKPFHLVLFGAILANSLLVQAQGNGNGPPNGQLPAVVGKGTLTIAGQGYWDRQSLEDGDLPSLSPFNSATGQVLPDGVYRYEFRTFPENASSPRQQDLMRGKGKGLTADTFKGKSGEKLSGRFEISGGEIVFK